MTDNEKIELLIAGKKAFDYALENCADELASVEGVRAVKTALTGPVEDLAGNRSLTAE